MNAYQKDQKVALRIEQRVARLIPLSAARKLRRAELTLHKWGVDEANGDIQRDTDGKPRRVWRNSQTGTKLPGEIRRIPIPDREAGALRTVKQVCDELGLEFYHQPDCRGRALYVADKGTGLNDRNYSQVGVSVFA